MATQDFKQIAEPQVASHIRIALNGVKEGITGHTIMRINQTGNEIIALNMYKPIEAHRKVGLSPKTPESADLERRIIKPKAFHVSIPTDWESINELNHNPRGPLSEVVTNSLKEAMEREVVRSAFGPSIVGPYDANEPPKEFDKNMIVKIGDRIPGRSSQFDNTTADRLLLAARNLQKNGVNFKNKSVYLAMTSDAYTTLLGDIRLSKDYVQYANWEHGIMTHFAGFEIVITECLPGGKKQPCEYDKEGKETDTPSIPLPQLPKDAPKDALPVKSYALYWDKPALETAIWKNMELKVGKQTERSFSHLLYGAFQMGCVRTEESRIGYIEMPA
ncbi:MAG: hypothetical protein C4617_05505 [Candidatus Liberibacter europaeus]|uniref:Uncharacterized protein n=1 Tax=Candidatus Liberibacter europaeus TaxID=744859 RepID=A0A2T4VWG2_9HYPH|nr:MAG: hypothetical protein C4617_05505 [Candidatus Liberibacter europaeus]